MLRALYHWAMYLSPELRVLNHSRSCQDERWENSGQLEWFGPQQDRGGQRWTSHVFATRCASRGREPSRSGKPVSCMAEMLTVYFPSRAILQVFFFLISIFIYLVYIFAFSQDHPWQTALVSPVLKWVAFSFVLTGQVNSKSANDRPKASKNITSFY